jgi:uncharacterized membrane protein
MKAVLRRVIEGGVYVVLPLCLIVFALASVYQTIAAAIEPLTSAVDVRFPVLWALFALLLLSFVCGLLLHTRPGRGLVAAVRHWLDEHSPHLRALHQFEDEFLGKDGNKLIKAAFAVTDDALVPAFVLEELPDATYVVFVPAAPDPSQGSIYVLPRQRVHLIDAHAREVAACVRGWGVGTGRLLERMRKPGGNPDKHQGQASTRHQA